MWYYNKNLFLKSLSSKFKMKILKKKVKSCIVIHNINNNLKLKKKRCLYYTLCSLKNFNTFVTLASDFIYFNCLKVAFCLKVCCSEQKNIAAQYKVKTKLLQLFSMSRVTNAKCEFRIYFYFYLLLLT